MAPTAEHLAAERALRDILPGAGLPQPDEVRYEPGEVLLLWHETKLAVVIELDGTGAGEAAG